MDLRPFTILSLCAGVGGLDLGLRVAQPNARTVCFVEIEAYAAAILATRMEQDTLDQAQRGQDGSMLRLPVGAGESLADRDHARCEEQCGAEPIQAQHEAAECRGLPALPIFAPGPEGDWSCVPEGLEPAICRMADGLAYRVDRIRACGNGVVPLAAAYAWRSLISRAKATTHGETD